MIDLAVRHVACDAVHEVVSPSLIAITHGRYGLYRGKQGIMSLVEI
jgi:hypothetical protein